MRLRLALLLLVAVAVAGVAVALHSRRSHPEGPLRRSAVALVGDSLNVGVEPYLRELLRGWIFHVDDEVGRPTATGLDQLRAAGAALSPYVVVSLGTNDPSSAVDAFRGDVEAALRIAGPARCVVWATIHRDGDAYGGFDRVLHDEAARNRNLRVVEWAAMVRAHPDWLAPDGIHASPQGYRARAVAVAVALQGCPATAAPAR